jgi:F-type H+-transporting ATPase subunit alpha
VYLRTQHPQILQSIREARDLSAETEEALKGAVKTYGQLFADPHSPVGTEDYAHNPILHETDADRHMSEEQLRLAARPEANAASARQSY